jgi:hypothetical protein
MIKTFEGAKLEIVLNIIYTLVGGEIKRIKYRKPVSALTGRWVATQKTPTSLAYTTIATDLDEPGIWEVQAYIEAGNTLRLYGEIARFEVLSHIPDAQESIDTGESGTVVIS